MPWLLAKGQAYGHYVGNIYTYM